MIILPAYQNNSDEWLEQRRKGIGSSDVAAIMDVPGAFLTPLQVWADKRNISTMEHTERTQELFWYGHAMEAVTAARLESETGWRLREEPATLAHDNYPFMMANIDRWIDIEGEPVGVAELKNVSSHRGDEWEFDAPVQYRVQHQHQLFVTGASWGVIAATIGGNQLVWHRYERNERFLAALLDKCKEFWQMVCCDNMPLAVAADSKILASFFGDPDEGKVVELPSECIDLDTERQEVMRSLTAMNKRKDEIDARIKQWIGDAAEGVAANGVTYSFRKTDRAAYSVQATSQRILRRKK